MPDEERPRRKARPYSNMYVPVLLPVTGFRDQEAKITYLPWSDVEMGLIGWEVIPDRRYKNVLVYILPNVKDGVFEIRCHVTSEDPDPATDRLLGSIAFPAELLDPPE